MNRARRILMAELEVPKRHRGRLEERVKAGHCIVCNEKAEPRMVRGLCLKHYAEFRDEQLSRGGKEAQAAYEEDCVRQGLILPHGEQSRMKSNSIFKNVG